MKKSNQPRVSIVGAGPGDPDLITVKGLKAIRTANAILYDALTSPELLEMAQEDCRKLFVGKRAGNHRYKQDEINLMIVQSAYSFGHVVRLKGGDPMIFGRGHEELEYVRSFDIPVTLIPGLSSATSLTGLQGVPLTRRHVSESFWVLTATSQKDKLATDISLAARSSATLVFLMGIRKIELIMGLLEAEGKKETPAMVIQSGSTNEERYVIGTVGDISSKVEEHNIGSPGIIIVGKVVGLHPEKVLHEVLVNEQLL